MPGQVTVANDAASVAIDGKNVKKATVPHTDARLVPMVQTRPELLDLDQHPWNLEVDLSRGKTE
jgi:hypothetical protein